MRPSIFRSISLILIFLNYTPALSELVEDCQEVLLTDAYSRVFISTSNYPANYSLNRIECWIVNTTSITSLHGEEYTIKLTTTDTEAQYDDLRSRCIDYIEVYDGATKDVNHKIKRWCQEASKPIFSTGGLMYIRFYSSPTIALRGFAGFVSVSVLAGQGPLAGAFQPCKPLYIPDGHMTYTLSSPGYPHDYPNNIDKCWVIYSGSNMTDLERPNPNQYIMAIFHDSSMEVSNFCNYDFIQTRDGQDLYFDLITEFCGSIKPKPIISCGPVMYVRFRSDEDHTSYGWLMTYKAIPADKSTCFKSVFDPTLVFGTFGASALLIIVVMSTVYCIHQSPNHIQEKLGNMVKKPRRKPVPIWSRPACRLYKPQGPRPASSNPFLPTVNIDIDDEADEYRPLSTLFEEETDEPPPLPEFLYEVDPEEAAPQTPGFMNRSRYHRLPPQVSQYDLQPTTNDLRAVQSQLNLPSSLSNVHNENES